MSGDKRSTVTDALKTLGSIIDETAARDAIHLAVEPIVAGQHLAPGEHVKIENGSAWCTGIGHGVGIVDPFLAQPVLKGERFWLVVYPRQITSLRHVWEHPDFPASIDVATVPQYSESEQWIRNFADRVSLHYDVLMDGAREWVDSKKRGGWSDYLCMGGLLEGGICT